jgi:hypothetical protein
MARSALVVGLGSTGQWVLTWLKRDLMAANDGEFPYTVKLLSIDTAGQPDVGEKGVSLAGKEQKRVEADGVSLDPDQRIYLEGDAAPEAEREKREELKSIGEWYSVKKWLNTQSPTAFTLDDGAGRLRQFGRMAVFRDLVGRKTESHIRRAVRDALDSLHASTSEQQRLEIIVVGSLAGNIDSGIYVDVAHTLRRMAQERKIHHVLRGYFALPSVFNTSSEQAMQMRMFTALRGLERFGAVDSDSQTPAAEDGASAREFCLHPTQSIFDVCYLVDRQGDGQTVTEESRLDLTTMMSEAIRATLIE